MTRAIDSVRLVCMSDDKEGISERTYGWPAYVRDWITNCICLITDYP